MESTLEPDASSSSRESKRQKTRATPASDILEKGAALLQSGKWSDFQIKCQDHVFKVHRVVLSGQSEYLDRAIEDGFVEASKQELDLSAEEPVIVATILWYLYTHQYRLRDQATICSLVNEPVDPTTKNSYLLLIKIYQLSRYFMLDALSKMIFRKLAELLRHFFGSLGRTKEEKNLHRPLFLECVHYLFSHETEDRVRELFAWTVTIMNDRRSKLFLLSDAHLDQLLETYPALGAYLYRSMSAHARLDSKCYDCETLMIREKGDRWLIVEFEDGPKLIRCCCAWKGLCSDSCYSRESKISRAGARCTNCAKSLIIQHAYQRKSFIWDVDQIKLVPEVEDNTQEITGDETGGIDTRQTGVQRDWMSESNLSDSTLEAHG